MRIMQEGWKISSDEWWGLDYQTIHELEEGDSEKEIICTSVLPI